MKQKGVGQAVESISSDTLRIVNLRNREAAGHVRKIGVECRVKADKLRHGGPEASYGLDQLDFVREMIRRKAHELLEGREQLVGDELRFNERRPAVNDAMTYPGQWRRLKGLSHTFQHLVDGDRMRRFVDTSSAQRRWLRCERKQPELDTR
jgi:hypothetical protein